MTPKALTVWLISKGRVTCGLCERQTSIWRRKTSHVPTEPSSWQKEEERVACTQRESSSWQKEEEEGGRENSLYPDSPVLDRKKRKKRVGRIACTQTESSSWRKEEEEGGRENSLYPDSPVLDGKKRKKGVGRIACTQSPVLTERRGRRG